MQAPNSFPGVRLRVLPQRFKFVQFEKPEGFRKLSESAGYVPFFAFNSGHERSALVPDFMRIDASFGVFQEEPGWACFQTAGKLPFDVVGLLAQVSQALAEQKISLCAVSSFRSDFFFVKHEKLGAALEALRKSGWELEEGTALPAAREGVLIPTLNAMGYMNTELDRYLEAFAVFAPEAPGRALDIGAAYGIATLAALENGASVIANDLDPRHLDLLLERVPAGQRTRLELRPGRFPEELEFEEGSLGAVLIARVLHFFEGQKIEHSLKKIRRWLAPGGKLFVTVESPYLATWAPFISIFEKNKAAGETWPGWVKVGDVITWAPQLPDYMNFMDPEILSRALTDAGFAVEDAAFISRPNFPSHLRLDGRESVGAIARA